MLFSNFKITISGLFPLSIINCTTPPVLLLLLLLLLTETLQDQNENPKGSSYFSNVILKAHLRLELPSLLRMFETH